MMKVHPEDQVIWLRSSENSSSQQRVRAEVVKVRRGRVKIRVWRVYETGRTVPVMKRVKLEDLELVSAKASMEPATILPDDRAPIALPS